MLHPALFGAFPVLSLWASNADEVTFADVRRPLLMSVAGCLALLLVMRGITGDWRRAGLGAAAWAVLFFTYGRVFGVLEGRTALGRELADDRLLMPIWLTLAIISMFAARRVSRPVEGVTRALNLVALAVLVIPLATVVPRTIGSGGRSQQDAEPALRLPARRADEQRDIFYLVFDRYPAERTLREQFGFDNRRFMRALRRLGFYVADESLANYPGTTLSLASSLNMRYLDDLDDPSGRNAASWAPAYTILKDHSVGRLVKNQGYRYVHIGNWWEGTRTSPLADVVYQYDSLSEFSRAFVNTTFLSAASRRGRLFGGGFGDRRGHWDRVRFQLSKIREARSLAGPTFVFAHLTIPHEPYVFGRDGSFQDLAVERRKGLRRAFIDQLQWLNGEILALLRELAAGPTVRRPVIVLQSDEGPHPHLWTGPELGRHPWSRASDGELGTKLRILNAYYLPGADNPPLYPSISPVNTFRIIFRLYFGARVRTLPDRTYIFRDWSHYYDFEPVTNRLRPR